ncbi:LytTR family transcriptional regulator [Crocinitomicaceae bacterium]|nr:LytTR family transcriptional regulator [Crocinitomicaceae bacterium]
MANWNILQTINFYKNVQLLDSKIVELSTLKEEFRSVYDELRNKTQDDSPIIQIKIGNKVKNILLSEIIWVQSDDYCVKVHTQNKSYNLRKSMKLMETELESQGFVRLHRSYIVNKKHVDAISYASSPCVLLKNGIQLKMSAGRTAKVKAAFKNAVESSNE